MDRVTKNAPFGTDNTPNLEYKIVGGKRVEVVAKNISNESSQKSKLPFNSPQVGPHGTPPMQIQPLFREYEYADLQKGYNTAKQHDVARKVTSYTSPFGDRTRSFRHGPPTFNKHTVLPPIGASQPPGNDFVSHVPSARELQKNQENVDATVALETFVAQKLRNYPTHKISVNDMYIELSSFDRDLTGYVSENQLGLVVLRHDLPFKLSTLKMMYKKFSDPRDPRMVNYEKFLKFLISCMSQAKSDEFTAEKSLSSERAASKNGTNVSSRQPTAKEGITDILMSCPVDGKFVTMIKEQLAGSDDWDLAQLYTTLRHSDRLHNHQLLADVIMRACVSERVPLTSSILTSMLQQAEIDHGKVDWRQFLAPLACAYIQLYPNRNIVDTAVVSRQNEFQIKNDSRASTNGFQSEHRSDRNSDAPSSTKVTPKDHLSAGWDEREPRGTKNPILNSSSMSKKEVGLKHDEMWMRNFTRLSHALKSYHPFKSNRLPRSEVERMVSNYNLIYNLGFPPDQLVDAVERAVVEKNSEGTHADVISVDNLLSNLLGN